MTMTDYRTFLARKKRVVRDSGLSVDVMPAWLYPWQARIVRWALRKGKAAIWADCGLGKTPMQLAWAQALGVRTLIVAPLCVSSQTVREGRKFGVSVHYAANQREADAVDAPIIVTNYERLDGFDASTFGAVVLDESSILKAFDGKTRTRLIEMFAQTPHRLCCTATPSPNDVTELANHAEFLGLMTRPEFLATWFVRIQEGHRTIDHHGWRMKRHAVQPFYRWLASWAVALKHPSDIGYSDDGFKLPPLRIHSCEIPSGTLAGVLFPELGVYGLSGRLEARRGALTDRIAALQTLIAEHPGQWIIWCALNSESDALASVLPDAVNVQGSDSYADKVGAVESFIDGRIRLLVTKPKILGFGLNLQQCRQMAFFGLTDSYESYYQCIRRCWRFGQTQPVDAYVIISEAERVVVRNIQAKEARADKLNRELLTNMLDVEREALCG